jgi:2-methylaconitate cis-trans-isomerase PrpF
MLEAIAAAVVFTVSIPLAYVSPSLAKASWVVLTLVVAIAFPHGHRQALTMTQPSGALRVRLQP